MVLISNIVVLSALCLMSMPCLFAQSPVGMVLRAVEQTELVRQGQQQTLRMADLLYPGDQVVAKAAPVTFLYCPSSEMITLQLGASVQLGPEELTLLSGAALQRTEARNCSLPRVALGSESLERVGGLRARGLAPIEIFLGGNVASDRPVFEWAAVEGEPEYLVTVKSGLGTILWQQKTGCTELVYPESLPALEPGSYLWEVLAEVRGEPVAQQVARFTIKPDPGLAGPGALDSSEKLLWATVLENAGYFSEAAACYRELRSENPHDERFTSRLAWLYWNSGLITSANAERKKLDPEEQ